MVVCGVRRDCVFWCLHDSAVDGVRRYGDLPNSKVLPLWLAGNVVVPLHHGIGVAMALLAYTYRSPTALRFALSFEVGEDVLHFAQVCRCAQACSSERA